MLCKSKQIWFVKAQLMRCLPKFNKVLASQRSLVSVDIQGPLR
jgi:hypothetical protein